MKNSSLNAAVERHMSLHGYSSRRYPFRRLLDDVAAAGFRASPADVGAELVRLGLALPLSVTDWRSLKADLESIRELAQIEADNGAFAGCEPTGPLSEAAFARLSLHTLGKCFEAISALDEFLALCKGVRF